MFGVLIANGSDRFLGSLLPNRFSPNFHQTLGDGLAYNKNNKKGREEKENDKVIYVYNVCIHNPAQCCKKQIALIADIKKKYEMLHTHEMSDFQFLF